jgi:hypothetical protein
VVLTKRCLQGDKTTPDAKRRPTGPFPIVARNFREASLLGGSRGGASVRDSGTFI